MKRTGHSFAGGRQVIARGMLRARSVVLILAVIGISTVALATPPFKVLFNIILSKGTASATLSEHVQVASTPVAGAHEGEEQGDYDDGNDWKLELETEGATDFYIQDLAIAPGGHTGWHTHPGIFIGTVRGKSGAQILRANKERTVKGQDSVSPAGTFSIVGYGVYEIVRAHSRAW